MNAPLPLSVSRSNPGAVEAVAKRSGVDCADLARRLAAETEGEVLFDAASRGRYATDASIYQIMPLGVFVPKTQRDVANAIDIARSLQAPLLPRGGGSSQCGQTTGAALVIDTSKHLRKVLGFDKAALTVTVEPGIVLDALNAWLKAHGLWFPVDVSTSAQATLGGMAGNNSCGSRSIAYGNMVHNVAGIDAWLADGRLLSFGPVAGLGPVAREIAAFVHGLADQQRGEIEARWPKLLRRVGGYNLDEAQRREGDIDIPGLGEHIGTVAAVQAIVAQATRDCVAAGSLPVDNIVAVVTRQQITSRAAEEKVIPRPA